jgi:hypothetical protein
MHIRTLTNPDRGIFRPFDRAHFCSTAADGSPYLSSHTLMGGELWIGHIFRDFPDEDWQISLRGTDEIRGAWSSFETAQRHLLQWNRDRQLADQELRRSWGLSVDLAKDEYRQIDLLAG